ncbi:AraC family transcriptional regulator [uncultured Marinococcus sp.]|uniref:AraC family transcriptional regulator n=1 Tax=uncultured Marinococcus sp. TaxID=487012 RepID=UPI002613682F|nr:AraC family transcriptional regulator [uncultured Marinococcus sp.]
MNKSLTAGKVPLNQYVHKIEIEGAVFHIHYWGVAPAHYDNPIHKHSFFELCYVLEGSGEYWENNRQYVLGKNSLFFTKPNTLHQIKSSSGLFLLYVGFELAGEKSTTTWRERIDYAKKYSDQFEQAGEGNYIERIWRELLQKASKPKHELMEAVLKGEASVLLLTALQHFVSFPKIKEELDLAETISPALQEAVLYIRDNISKPLHLLEVASFVHVSERHLSRLFFQELNITFSHFIKKERVDYAVHLLRATSLPIKEVAEQSGFSSIHYFTRVFKETMEISPGEYKKSYMKNSSDQK